MGLSFLLSFAWLIPAQLPDFVETGSAVHSYYDEDKDILYIEANGQDGESGRFSWMGGEPTPGSSGASAGNISIVLYRMPREVIISARGGAGGGGAQGARGRPGRPGEAGRDAAFMRSAKPGSDGQNGEAGGDGSAGGNGGQGGQVKVVYFPSHENYVENWQNRVRVDVSGGLPGEGGPGGDGGLGGEAGPGGRGFWFWKSKESGRRGMDGAPGRQGPWGEPGEEGRVQLLEQFSYQEWIFEELVSL